MSKKLLILKRWLVLSKRSASKGFTLIEMLVVISLIGILLTVSVTAFAQSRKTARDAKRKADLEQIRSALEIYRTDCKTYPEEISFGGALTGTQTGCLGNTYLSKVPQDPLPSTYTYYYLRSGSNRYYLCAFLETQAALATQCLANCGAVCNYEVSSP